MKQDKLLLIVDAEGCVGVYENTSDTVRLMINELDYVLHFFSLTYEITVLDLHGGGGSINLQEKYEDVRFVSSLWQVDFTRNYDKAALLGFHSKYGSDGILSHTFRPEFSEIKMEEFIIGEIGVMINWLASYNIPVVLVTGDSSIVAETKLFEVASLVVKDRDDNRDVVDFETTYELIVSSLDNQLKNDIKLSRYLDSKLYVKLINCDYLNYLPSKLFKVQEGMIEFSDTRSFVSCLTELAIFLNSINNYHNLKIRQFIQYVRCNYSKQILDKITDVRFMTIFKQSNLTQLRISDIEHCYDVLKTISSR